MPCATGDDCDQGKVFLHTWKPHCLLRPGSDAQEHYGVTAAPAHPTPPSTAHPTVSCITWKGSSSKGSSSSNQKNPFVACTQGTFPMKSLHVGTNNNKNRALWDHHQQIQSPQEDERQSGFRKVETGSEGCREHPLISPPATPPVPKRG